MEVDPENIVLTETVNGYDIDLMMIEVWDGLYTPIGVRKPKGINGPISKTETRNVRLPGC